MTFLREIISIPFGYLIGFFYDISGNYIFSLFLMTVVVKLILLPFSIRQQKSMAKGQRLQPKIRRIREKYAGDQKKIQEEMNALYSREGYSAMTGGCGNTIVQLVIMMGVYYVNYKTLSYVLRLPQDVITKITDAVKNLGLESKTELSDFRLELTALSHWNEIDKSGLSAEVINQVNEFIDKFTFFGVSLHETPKPDMGLSLLWLVPVITGIISFATAVYSYLRQRKTNPEMAKNPSMGCMTFMTPLMSIWFSFLFPASVGVYIIMSSLLQFIQMVILNIIYSPKKVLAKLMVEETINNRAREKVLKNVAQTLSEDKNEDIEEK